MHWFLLRVSQALDALSVSGFRSKEVTGTCVFVCCRHAMTFNLECKTQTRVCCFTLHSRRRYFQVRLTLTVLLLITRMWRNWTTDPGHHLCLAVKTTHTSSSSFISTLCSVRSASCNTCLSLATVEYHYISIPLLHYMSSTCFYNCVQLPVWMIFALNLQRSSKYQPTLMSTYLLVVPDQ